MNWIPKTKDKAALSVVTALVMTLVIAALASITAYAADNPLRFTVEQLAVSSPQTEAAFTYKLKALGSDNPMPSGSTAEGYMFELTGNSSFEIGPISYNQENVYKYELFQVVETKKPGYIYDKRVYTIEVHVDEAFNVALIAINVDGTKADKIEFENGYEQTIVAGSKTWDHSGNTGDRPESVVIHVVSDGVSVESKRVTAEDDWKWSFALPKYTHDGNLAVYTIEEENVPGYTIAKNEGYSLTNKYVSPKYPGDRPKTGDNSNILLWVGLTVACAVMLLVFLADAAIKRKKRRVQCGENVKKF